MKYDKFVIAGVTGAFSTFVLKVLNIQQVLLKEKL